jgi:hypothetical protein
MTKTTVCLLLSVLPLQVQSLRAERFESASGISIERPANWRILSTADIQRMSGHAQLADPQLERQLGKLKEEDLGLLVILARDSPSHSDSEPRVGLYRQAIPPEVRTLGPDGILRTIVADFQRGYPNSTLISSSFDKQVSGYRAAEVTITFLQPTDYGMIFDTWTRAIIVLRDTDIFLIGMAALRRDLGDVEDEFTVIANSLRVIGRAK